MVITEIAIVSVCTLIFGAITKAFIDPIPNRFIPIQNVIIGIISAIVFYLFFSSDINFVEVLITCLVATLGAGGAHQVYKACSNKKDDEIECVGTILPEKDDLKEETENICELLESE